MNSLDSDTRLEILSIIEGALDETTDNAERGFDNENITNSRYAMDDIEYILGNHGYLTK